MSATPEKGTQEWGTQWAQGLWDGLFARYDPLIDGQVVLDLGCSWGYTLKFFAERFRPAKLIGVDLTRRWQAVDHGWEYELLGGLVEFHDGHFAEMDQLEPASVDLIISSSTLQYMTADEVEAACLKANSVLRPGGEAIIRTRTATSHIGSDLHRVFDVPYPHLLYGRPALETVTAEAARALPKLNFLTASSYLAIYNYSGFEIIDVVRRRNSAANREVIEDRIRRLLPGISDDELFCADLDVRMVKPIDPKDLPALAPD